MIWLAAVLSGVFLLIIALALVLETEWTKHFLTQQASEAAGRAISIDGDLSLDWSLKPLVSAEAIRVENAPWGSTEHMVTIERLAVRINLLELLRLRVEIPEIELIKPVVVLEKNKDGEANWALGTGKPEDQPGQPDQDALANIPAIGSLAIEDGRLTYRDPAQDDEIELAIAQLNAKGAEGDEHLTLNGDGQYQGKPFSLNLSAGSINRLGDEEEPYPLDLSVMVGETEASVAGTIVRPLNVEKVDADVFLSGPDLAALPPIPGISLPPSPAYSMKGRLTHQGDVWDFKNMSGQIGESDVSGDIKVDLGENRPSLYATLASRKLRFEDLAAVGGGGSPQQSQDKPKNEESGRVLPSAQFDLNWLQAMNARIVFTGQEILAPGLPINDINFTAELTDDRLVVQPFDVGVADGEITGNMLLNGRTEPQTIEADLDIKQINVKPLFEQTEHFDNTTGLFGGKLELRGAGQSVDEILAASDGRLAVAMTGGSFSAFAIEAMGLDVGEILAVKLTETDGGVPIRCMVGELPVTSGIAQLKTLLLDTTDAEIIGGGQINLAEETIDAEVLAYPKDPSILSLQRPVDVNGTFADLKFGVGSLPLRWKGSPSDARGGAFASVLSLVPFIERTLGENSDCEALIKSARAFGK